jgi:eukaryotic-like serine/threonine-protein kinase
METGDQVLRTAFWSELGGSGGLDPRAERQLRERLRTIAGGMGLVFGALVLLELCVVQLLGGPQPSGWHLQRGAGVGLLFLCAGIYTLACLRSLPGDTLVPLAVGFQILGAVLLSIPTFWGRPVADPRWLPWVAVWVALYPLVVPLGLLSTTLGTLAAASAPLAVFGLWIVFKGPANGDPRALAYAFLPTYLAAGVAILPAYRTFLQGSQAAAATERARTLGSYRLVRLLGAGGMGEVWEAEHSLLRRPAAVKLISAEFLEEAEEEDEVGTALARFEREARTTSSLRSPHTIALYDYGRTDDGTLFYVMELLEGTDLESLVERFGPLPPARVVHLVAQACCSLAEAHQTGLVHRDVKPANIYVCRMGLSHDFVKVLDFGLVAMNEKARKTGEAKLTADGFIVGTPSFLAPEMAGGKPLDGRVDIYGLGCVAYWLLTGHNVFEGTNAVELMIAHAKTPPVPPSERLGRALPADLEAVVMACLAKSPDDRPADAQELARRLRACALEDSWSQDQAVAWWREHQPQTPASGDGAGVAERGQVTESWPQLPPDGALGS